MSNDFRKMFGATFTKADSPRAYDVVLSDAGVDRERDRIPTRGWRIPRYVPLLWAHDPNALPIGRVVGGHVAGDELRGRVEFPPRGLYGVADTVADFVETGFVNSFSVGFRADEPPVSNSFGGVDFVGPKTLYELSAVNIPANERATVSRTDFAGVVKWMSSRRGRDEDVVLELDDEPADVVLEVDGELAAYVRALALRRRGMNSARLAGLLEPEQFDVDINQLRTLLAETVTGSLREVTRTAVTTALDRIRGRVVD